MYKRLVKAGLLVFSAVIVLASFGCGNQSAPATHENVKPELVLPLTLGGFLKDGPEYERLGGVCAPDDARTLLNCDIYNGLPGWTITEVTLFVSWLPYADVRHYQVPILIKPQTAEHVTVRLGLQLPPDDFSKLPHGRVTRHQRWSWQVEGAKGYPAK